MQWTVRCFFLFVGFFIERVSAGKQCREERSISGMALQGFILKKFFVRALHECDISCETEITCQSYNYVLGEKLCELNSRTKEARPENFRSDPARFYKRRFSNRGMCEKNRKLSKHRSFWKLDINRRFNAILFDAFYRLFVESFETLWWVGRVGSLKARQRKNIRIPVSVVAFKCLCLGFLLNPLSVPEVKFKRLSA